MLSPVIANGNKLPFNYCDYANNSIDLKKYTIPDLKTVARAYKLAVSGTKPLIIDRIEIFFKQSKYAIRIQKNIRRHFVKHSFSLRGSAFRNRGICVNDTDFYTMEPLEEIPGMFFFSYTDEKGYCYGCNILSLLKWLKQKPGFINPYNRDKIENTVKNTLFELCRLIQIMNPDLLDKETTSIFLPGLQRGIRVYRPRLPRRLTIELPQDISGTSAAVENVILHSNAVIHPIHTETDSVVRATEIVQSPSHTITNRILTPQHRRVFEKMEQIRAKPVNTRIQELFMEIDSLGNYTQSSWFSNLESLEYLMLYRAFYNIWRFQGIPSIVKNMIAPLIDNLIDAPFLRNRGMTMTREQIQEICLKIAEDLVFSGIDVEHRKLGALHVLRALTMACLPARQSLPWLYDSM
jgi:hypothetical protein